MYTCKRVCVSPYGRPNPQCFFPTGLGTKVQTLSREVCVGFPGTFVGTGRGGGTLENSVRLTEKNPPRR